MNVFEALKERRSIRAFDNRPVPELTISRIVQAALEFPSWSNTQPFNIPKDYKLICGLSLGYAKDDPVNEFKPDRREVADVILSQE